MDQLDAGGSDVIDPISGDDVMSSNDASVTGTYNSGTVGDDDASTDLMLDELSIATQKSVAIVNDTGGAGATAGDTLEYTLEVQISDFFSFTSVVLDDNFSDGQLFDATFSPTWEINENGVMTSGTFTSGVNFTSMLNSPGDGSTDLSFDLSAVDGDGVLSGDLVAPDMTLTSGTTVTVTFRTVIQDAFLEATPSNDASVDIGDILSNSNVVTGTLPSGQTESDNGSTSHLDHGPYDLQRDLRHRRRAVHAWRRTHRWTDGNLSADLGPADFGC